MTRTVMYLCKEQFCASLEGIEIVAIPGVTWFPPGHPFLAGREHLFELVSTQAVAKRRLKAEEETRRRLAPRAQRETSDPAPRSKVAPPTKVSVSEVERIFRRFNFPTKKIHVRVPPAREALRFDSNYFSDLGWLTELETAWMSNEDDASWESFECEVDRRFDASAPYAHADSRIACWNIEGREILPRETDEFGTWLFA